MMILRKVFLILPLLFSTSAFSAIATRTPLGSAILTDPGDGTYIVSNIGSSGEDGVSINLTGQSFNLWSAVIDPLGDATTYPDGSSISITSYGLLDGVEQVISTATAYDAGGAIALDFSFPNFGNLMQVEFSNSGVVLAAESLDSTAGLFALADLWPDSFELSFNLFPPGVDIGFDWNLGTPITTPGGATVIADLINLVPDTVPYTTIEYTRAEITAALIPSFTVVNETTTSVVPVLPSVWLFISGFVGLVGVAKRRAKSVMG